MRFSKYFLIILFMACVSMAHAQQNNVLTLQQCLDIAIKNNLTVRQDSVMAEQARIGFTQAKDNLLPSITGFAGRELTSGRALNPVTNNYITQSVTSDNYNMQGSVTIFNGMALQSAIKQASLAFQSGKMAFQAAKDIVTVNVITNYLAVLDAGEILGQSKAQLAQAKENLDKSETLEKYGNNKVASDYTDFKGQYAGSQVAVVQNQGSLDMAKLSLFNIMNIPFNRDARLQPLNADQMVGDNGISPDQVYDTALQQLAEIKAATLMRQSAEKGVRYAKGLLYPSLNLGGGIGTNYSNLNSQSYADQFRNNYGTYVQLGLNIPIFTNHIKKNNVALAKLSLLNYTYIEDNIKVVLKQNIQQAWYSMNGAYSRYQALDAQVKAYTESFRIFKIRLDAGVITSTDFIIAKNNLDNATLNLISARYDYFIYSKILDYYQGKLAL